MKLFIKIIIAIVLLITIIFIIGSLLPQNHVVSRTMEINKPVATVWKLINEHSNQVAWRSGLRAVEVKTNNKGNTIIIETDNNGDAIRFEIIELIPQQKLVSKIADKTLPFGGTWTISLKPSQQGCLLTITEQGEVYNPFFRFMSRFIFGHTASIDNYMTDLKSAVN